MNTSSEKRQLAIRLLERRRDDFLIADVQLTNSVIRVMQDGAAIEDIAEILNTSVEEVSSRLARTSVELKGGTLSVLLL